MALINSFLASLRRDEEGQGLAEYALILALIAIVAIIALIFLGGQVSTILSTVGNVRLVDVAELIGYDRRSLRAPAVRSCPSHRRRRTFDSRVGLPVPVPSHGPGAVESRGKEVPTHMSHIDRSHLVRSATTTKARVSPSTR